MEKNQNTTNNRTRNGEASPDSLSFKPLTEGLGLNHFTEGLPYTPAAAKRRATVQFNFPPPRAPRQYIESVPPEFTPQIQSQKPIETVDEFSNNLSIASDSYASFIRRSGAYLVDVVLASAIFVLVVWSGFAINGFNVSEMLLTKLGSQLIGPLALLYLVVYMGYFLIQETTWRRTLGKSFFGIKIQSRSGLAIVGRTVCFFVSAIPFGLGLFWYFFDSKHRCWHDVISDCEVRTG